MDEKGRGGRKRVLARQLTPQSKPKKEEHRNKRPLSVFFFLGFFTSSSSAHTPPFVLYIIHLAPQENVAPGMPFARYKQPCTISPNTSLAMIPSVSAMLAETNASSRYSSRVFRDIRLKPATYTAPPSNPATKQGIKRLQLYLHGCEWMPVC